MEIGEPTKIQKENWQQHQTSVLSSFLYLYKSKVLSDVIFLINENENIQTQFLAHKFLLSIRSVVFESMFSHSKDKKIIVSDVSSQGFETMLRFLYTDNMDLNNIQQALDAFHAAKKYGLPFMQKQCENYICKRITVESVCQIYELIKETKISKILYQCLITMSKNIKEVLKSDAFLSSQLTTVMMITKRSNMALDSEYNLFTAIINWCKEECFRLQVDEESHLSSIIEPFLPHIRFLAMNPIEFAKILDNTNLFYAIEAYPILLKLILPNAKINLPKFLNNKTTSRNFSSYFACRPFVTRTEEPIKMLKQKDIFKIDFQIIKTDIFLLGVTLSILQQNQCAQSSEIEAIIQIKFLSTTVTEQYLSEINLYEYSEPYLAFPYPILIKEGERINIKIQIQNINELATLSIFRYQELIRKFQQNETEFLFDSNNIDETIISYQISSLHYFI